MNNLELKQTVFENIENSNGKFTKHFHDTYTIGLTNSGRFKSIVSNQSCLSYQNSTRIINPGEVHYGDSQSWHYTNFYPKVELLVELYDQMYSEKKIPVFKEHIIEDIQLFSLLCVFFQSAFTHADKMLIETNMINVLSYLIKNYTNHTKEYLDMFNDKEIIKNSIEYINDSLESNLSLDELSQNSNLSKYHFLRVFKKNVGLTPHHYILTQRIHKAKDLVLNGTTLSDAGLEVGFNDQSHFIRNFRKIYGYSPKELLKKSNFVLY